MPEKYRIWDVINYFKSPEDAWLYLEAAAEEDEGDGELIRRAWSDIERAHNAGKVSIELTVSGKNLCQTLLEHGVYEWTIPKIVKALGTSSPTALK